MHANEQALSVTAIDVAEPRAVFEGIEKLLTPEGEAKAFWRLRWWSMRTVIRQTLVRTGFQLSIVVFLSSILWVGLFFLFADGFLFLKNTVPADLHMDVIEVMYGVFFVTLMVMLAFSTGIILYGSLFRAPDVAWMLTLPVRPERVFLFKYQEAVALSSWAFLLLGSPMLLAFGVVEESPWFYFVMMPLFLIFFTHIPGALGGIICLGLVYRLARRPKVALMIGVGALLAAIFGMVWLFKDALAQQTLAPEWFQQIFSRLQFTQHRLLPSWWLSGGLLEAGLGNGQESLMFLCLIAANALFFRQLAVWTAAAIFRGAYARSQARSGPTRRVRTSWLDKTLWSLSGFLPGQVRILLLKDFRLFRRDPVQWTQFLIFFGLLLLYFLNIRRFTYETYYQGWVNMVSLLNLTVVALLLATFTTRFIFPMISLEGRNFWILGLLPVRRETILWSKFLFASLGALLPCCGLILLSDGMLGVSPGIIASHQLTCVSLCLGLSGLAVGLGATIPSFREQSPAKIAAGFGGTLNLILSTVLIVILLVLGALPTHLLLGSWTPGGSSLVELHPQLGPFIRSWWLLGQLATPVVGLAFAGIPLSTGIYAFRRIEF